MTDTTLKRSVPYVDISVVDSPLRDELMDAFSQVLSSGQFVFGKEIEEFEARFAKLCGTRFAVSVNSGTDAMILSLRALEIGVGDEVITAPNSYIATAAAIAHVGARPVFVDVGTDFNIDPDLIESAITPRTKAILPVHLTGRPANMDAISEIADRFGLFVLEDAAQAVLARYNGKSVGGLGTMGAFSLHPLKTLSACGDGGIVTTNEKALAERIMRLRNHGLVNRVNCVEWGYNSRLDTIQAELLLKKLKYLEEWTKRRQQHAALYQQALRNVPGIQTPTDALQETSVYHTFIILAERRDELSDHLADCGVETAIHYPTPIHLQPPAAELGYKRGDFPVTEQQAVLTLSLPVHHGLEEDDIRYVAEMVRDFFHS